MCGKTQQDGGVAVRIAPVAMLLVAVKQVGTYNFRMLTAAITGITGLAGGHLANALRARGCRVIGISRRFDTGFAWADMRVVPDLTDVDALRDAFRDCGIIFHFADRAQRKSYRKENVGVAARVVTAMRTSAQQCGVRRIVAASSVYAEDPYDLYGRSKRGMEEAALAASSGTPAVILRLPPLYGSGARGSVRHIARAAERGWPLPFKSANAPRRFLSLDALAELCGQLVELDDQAFAAIAGRTFTPVAPQIGSLAALSRTLGHGRTRLFPVPGIDLLLGGRVSRESLERDHDALRVATGWQALC